VGTEVGGAGSRPAPESGRLVNELAGL